MYSTLIIAARGRWREVKQVGREGKSGKTMILSGLTRMAICGVAAWMSLSTMAATNELHFGQVQVDAKTRTISFPAQINQRAGAIEYLLVH